MTSMCRNCGQSKTPDFYAENYCSDCTTVLKNARTLAVKENLDIGTASRQALAERAHDIHRNRLNPRMPIGRGDLRPDSGIVVLLIAVILLVIMPAVAIIAAAMSWPS